MITEAIVKIGNKSVKIDLSQPIDLSIPLQFNGENPNAWYVDQPKITPVEFGGWIGSVAKGGDVNFKNIWFSPHANGTHTETVGHVTKELVSINKQLCTFFFEAEIITILPKLQGEDQVITKTQLQEKICSKASALIIRTLPNSVNKLTKQYSHTNPAYISEEAAGFLKEIGIKHLLIDLPSIDKEKDDGALAAHKAFWDYKGSIRTAATITEFIYVPDQVPDGMYVLNLQIAPFENDATPSKPVVYKIIATHE